MTRQLRSGYTTGACAAAAAKGAALMLTRQERVNEVSIDLPAGVEATFQLHGQIFTPDFAACFVVKDAGDDPDVTNGAEVHARIGLDPPQTRSGDSSVIITGGIGIGKITKPGLAIAPGQWAINPVPRRMIADAVHDAFTLHPSHLTPHVVISIPDGEIRARKTLNARLGIIGGLSILGTTGIVRPISAKAWTDTIDAALDVARACGCPTVVLSTGRSSELAAQKLLSARPANGSPKPEPRIPDAEHRIPTPETLPEEAYVMMGDHVGYALRACHQRGFDRPMIACQFAKLLKIACGYENTHAAASKLDLAELRTWAEREGIPTSLLDLIGNANTAREIIIASRFDPPLLNLVHARAHRAARNHATGLAASFLVADYSGNIIFSS